MIHFLVGLHLKYFLSRYCPSKFTICPQYVPIFFWTNFTFFFKILCWYFVIKNMLCYEVIHKVFRMTKINQQSLFVIKPWIMFIILKSNSLCKLPVFTTQLSFLFQVLLLWFNRSTYNSYRITWFRFNSFSNLFFFLFFIFFFILWFWLLLFFVFLLRWLWSIWFFFWNYLFFLCFRIFCCFLI